MEIGGTVGRELSRFDPWLHLCALLGLAYPMTIPWAPDQDADNGRATSQRKCSTSTMWNRSAKAVHK